MTVQGVAGPTWLLRLLLVVGLGLLVTVLTSLWSAPSAHAAPSPTGDLASATVTGPAGDEATSVASVTETVATTEEPGTESVASVLEPVGTEPVAPATEAAVLVHAPVTETQAPVSEAVPPVTEALPPVIEAVAPATEAVAPVIVVLAPATGSTTEVLAPLADALTPVAGVLLAPASPVVSPVLDAVRSRVPSPGHREQPGDVTGSAGLPVTSDPAAVPCPPAAAPVVPTLRPSSPWSPRSAGDGEPHPADRLPVTAPPPTVEHLRGGASDHPRPTGGPAAVLSMPTAGTSSGGRGGADGALPSEVGPPQLRVLSVRAGPGPEPATAPQIEILDSPA